MQEQLLRLERDGFIVRREGKKRAIELTAKAGGRVCLDRKPPKPLPLLGRVAAGEALFADENVEQVLDVPDILLANGDDGFILRVQGDSMTGAGLVPGDLIVVRCQPDADDVSLATRFLPTAIPSPSLSSE